MYLSAKQKFDKFLNNKPIDVLPAASAKKDLMFENVGKVSKKVLISDYEQLCNKYANTDTLYTDK